jgi:hypothetical protein
MTVALDWFIALAATTVAALLAVAGGIWLFHYQSQESEQALENKLFTRVALESKMNLEILAGRPTEFFDAKTGKAAGQAVAVPLSTVALRDLIRSNVLEPEDALGAMWLEGHINAHNREVDALLQVRGGLITWRSLQFIISEVAERQAALKEDFEAMVQHLQDQGFEVPD